MAQEKDMSAVFNALDSLLGNTDLSDVTSENGGGFEQLPDGYYLCEVVKAELTEAKSSHNPMVSLQLKAVENGYAVEENGDFKRIDKTKGKVIFKHYPFTDERSIKRFVSDMLKFEGDTVGEPILPKEAFTTAETINDSLDVLVGLNIYIQLATTPAKNEGEKDQQWPNVISWKRAGMLELPE